MDMTKEFRCWCPTNRNWSHAVKSGSKTYRVRYGYTPTGDCQYGYTCTCEAFKFGKGKECKHIKEAKKQHCMWNHEACMGAIVDIPEDGKCPVCGEELETIAILV